MPADEQILDDALAACQQLLEQQNWRQAGEICASIDAVIPDHPQVIYFAGLADLGLGQLAEAETRFHKLLRLNPELVVAHKNLAQVSISRGDLAMAIERLACAKKYAPDDVDVHRMLIEFYLFTGDIEVGRAAIDDARACAARDDYIESMAQALEAGEQARAMPFERGTVAIISDDPRVREAKLAAAAASQGWRPILFCRNLPSYDAGTYFADVIQYQSPWEAVVKVAAMRPQAYHCCAQMKYETCAAFLAARPGPIICDFYDNVEMLSEDFLQREPVRRFDRTLERSVMVRAEGLVCRNLESQVAKRREGVDVPARRIFFTEYAWGDVETLAKLSSKDGELHIFYGGVFWIEKQFPEYADSGGMYWLAELLSEQKIHFHLYPAAGSAEEFDDLYSDYRELEGRSEYFHLHRPVRDMRAFLREASQYDAGIYATKTFLAGGTMKQYMPMKMKLAFGNKMTDYVDAGLLYITHRQLFQFQVARHLGFAIDVDEDFLEKSFWIWIKQQVLNSKLDFDDVRRRFDLAGQAPRLTRFYESFR